MHTRFLARFLIDLGPPLGADIGDNIWDASKSASNFRIIADPNGYINFNEVLYETVRFAFKEKVFKTGLTSGIQQMKDYDRQVRLKLHSKKDDYFSSKTIFEKTKKTPLNGNFNVLSEYIYVLTVFKTWEIYTQKVHIKKDFSLTKMLSSTRKNQRNSQSLLTLAPPT